MLFLTALKSVALLLVMAVPGFIIGKLKMIDKEKAVSFISVMLLYVTQPFVTFDAFLNTPYDSTVLLNLIMVFVITGILMVLTLAVGKLVMTGVGGDLTERAQSVYAGTFGNVGYLCIPFLQLFAPNDSVLILYATSAIVGFNLISWTLGNYLLTGDKKYMSLKKAIFNPPTLSFIIALPLFICNINFPRFNLTGIQNLVGLFADMVGPLAMTLLGIKISETSLRELFLDGKVYASSLIKLVICPALCALLILIFASFMDISSIKLNLVAFSAMPSANNVMMFSSRCGLDTKYPAKFVMISTLLSIVSIPLTLMLLL